MGKMKHSIQISVKKISSEETDLEYFDVYWRITLKGILIAKGVRMGTLLSASEQILIMSSCELISITLGL